MAITYFAIDNTSGDPMHLDIPESMLETYGAVLRVWIEGTPPTPTDKWIILGTDQTIGMSPRLRSISPSRKNAMINVLLADGGRHNFNIEDYGWGAGRYLRHDIKLPAAVVNAL